MAISAELETEVFLDSAYLIAVAQPQDTHHAHAVKLAEDIRTRRTQVVTSRAVLLEVGSALSRLRFRPVAIRLLAPLETAPTVQVVPLGEELVRTGWELFRSRPDKEWSWVDCISFVLMRQRGISQALTTDEHFVQAGFKALLRD